MSWESHPLTPERFGDFADVINPNRRTTHCWCLSHRLRAKDIEELGKGDRQQAMRRLSHLTARSPAPCSLERPLAAQGRNPAARPASPSQRVPRRR